MSSRGVKPNVLTGVWNGTHTVWTSQDGRFQIARREREWAVIDTHELGPKPQSVRFPRYSLARNYLAGLTAGNVRPIGGARNDAS